MRTGRAQLFKILRGFVFLARRCRHDRQTAQGLGAQVVLCTHRAQALKGRVGSGGILVVVGRDCKVVEQLGVVAGVESSLHQLALRLRVLALVQMQQAAVVARRAVTRIKLHRHLVTLLGQCQQVALALDAAIVIGQRVEKMQIRIVEVGLEREIEQVVGLLELVLVERLHALRSELARGVGELGAFDAGIKIAS